jgi:hypothetical protein
MWFVFVYAKTKPAGTQAQSSQAGLVRELWPRLGDAVIRRRSVQAC